MRYDRIQSRGLGFAREVDIDFTSIPGTLIAVCGPNGAGKSLFLESLSGAVDRDLPTRGSIGELAALTGDRGAYLKVDVVNGKPWHIEHSLDGASGTGSCSVTDADGKEALDDDKRSTFDDWAASTFAPKEVRFATTFSPQKSIGFVGMKPSERRKIILRVSGAELLEAKASKARKVASEAKARLDVLTARLGEMDPSGSWETLVSTAEGSLEEAGDHSISCKASLRFAEKDLSAAEEEAARVGAILAAERDRQRSLSVLDGRLLAARARMADLNSRIANNDGVIERADEIRTASEIANGIDERIGDWAARVAELREEHHKAETFAAAAAATARECVARTDAAKKRVEAAKARLAERDAVVQATDRAAALRADVGTGERLLAEADAAVETLHANSSGVAEKRIASMRTALEALSRGESDESGRHDLRASEALATDDRIAKAGAEAPEKLRFAKVEAQRVRGDLAKLRADLSRVEALAARSKEMEVAHADFVAAVAEHEDLCRAENIVINGAAEDARLACRAIGVDLAASLVRIEEQKKVRAELVPVLKLAEPLLQAQARIAELTPQHEACALEMSGLEREVLAVKASASADPLPSMPDVEAMRRKHSAASAAESSAEHRVNACTERLAQAKVAYEKIRGVRDEVRTEQESISDWTRLANDLGKDGLQNMVVDACGPEVTALTNNLLHTCHGPRWTVAIETQKLVDGGKRVAEGFEVRVYDGKNGRNVLADRLSGGEGTIVSEAVSLALTMIACRRWGIEGATLIRDESAAALDPEGGRAYVAMLRKAAIHTKASKVLFVSHSQEMLEEADARIEVSEGQVVVRMPN